MNTTTKNNPYEYQRVRYWARKMETLDADALQRLIEKKKPEEGILQRARELYEKGV